MPHFNDFDDEKKEAICFEIERNLDYFIPLFKSIFGRDCQTEEEFMSKVWNYAYDNGTSLLEHFAHYASSVNDPKCCKLIGNPYFPKVDGKLQPEGVFL